MLVGLMSDTHDRLEAIDAAVEVFNARGVGYVLHAGDHVAPFVVRRYGALSCPWRGIFGNNDGERAGLLRVSEGRIAGEVLRLELGGLPLLVCHRKEQGLAVVQAGTLGPVEVLICGHTHEKGSWRDGDLLVVNPGEASGYLTGQPTVALLDTETLEVEWVRLAWGPPERTSEGSHG